MGSWRKVEWSRHETEEKNEEGEKCPPAASGVERRGIVDGRDAKETHAEKEDSPNVPALPKAEEAESEKDEREKDRNGAVERSTEGTQYVAAVELGNGQKIERSCEKADPGGAADGMKQESARRDAGMHHGREEAQEKWNAEG